MEILGCVLRDSTRTAVGRVRSVLLDPDTKNPRWLEVAVADGETTVLVPAAAVSEFAAGELLVPYTAPQIERASHPSGSPLTVDEAERLREHYGFAD